jgi:hypothetical protein
VVTTRTKACLRIRGDQGSTAEISTALGLTPSRSHDIGQPRGSRDSRPWPHLLWVLDSDLPDTATLEHHLGRLCDRLEPHAAALKAIQAQGMDLDWFCFVEIESGQGGVPLSAELLRRLAAFPAELDLDIYG